MLYISKPHHDHRTTFVSTVSKHMQYGRNTDWNEWSSTVHLQFSCTGCSLSLFPLSLPRSLAARSQLDKQINCLRAAKQENIHNKCTTEGVTTWKHNKASLIFCAGTFQGVHWKWHVFFLTWNTLVIMLLFSMLRNVNKQIIIVGTNISLFNLNVNMSRWYSLTQTTTVV